ncbi:hypothetical protein BGZ94_001594, partial [Podila epigama]
TSLEQYLKVREKARICEKDARRIIRELASAVAHCHSRFVVHRDLKPANVLITPERKVMLIDFGLGNVFSHRSRLNTICGSLPYYSPEIARGSSYIGPEIDIWCLGVILYRMTVGRDPFVGATKREVKSQIVQENFQLPATLSVGLQQTLRKLLSHDGGKRRNLMFLENDAWLHEDIAESFVSEDRGIENGRLSGTTLVRQSSKTLWKRHSQTGSYCFVQGSSTLGSSSVLGDVCVCVWQVDKRQPRFHKNRIRIATLPDAEADMLFQKDQSLSLLQFLLPILHACQVSYYIHSTNRILCGTSFVKNASVHNPPTVVLQKVVQQVGALMTGSMHENRSRSQVRCGVFSVDIVRVTPSKSDPNRGQYILVVKRLFGSSSTVQYFKRQFLSHATRDTHNKQLQS